MILQNLHKFGLTKIKVTLFSSICLLAAAFDGFGMAMFLPLMEFIEKGRDVSILANDSRMWEKMVALFDYFKLEINLLSLIVIITTLMMFRIVFMYIRRIYTAWLSQDVSHHIRMKLFKAFLYADYNFYTSVSSGYTVNLINIEALRTVSAFSSLFLMASNALVIIGFISILFWVSVPMTLLAALFLFTAAAIVTFYIRHTKKISALMTISNEKLSFLLLERLNAFRLIKITATTKREVNKVSDASKKVRNHNYWSQKLNARVDLLLEPMVIIGALFIFYFSITYFNTTLSMLGLFMLILIRLIPICKEFLRARQSYVAQQGGFQAVLQGVRNAEKAAEINNGQHKLTGLNSGIKLKNIEFTYPGQGEPALSNINLFIPAGKMTALVGPSGAGKSTLVDLLPQLRIPQHGVIYFDDHRADDFETTSLRSSIAFVSQDIFIFNDTIFENISFANKDATKKEVWEVLEKAKATEFVNELPDGLETVLGERGVKLSGGQRQRISLARALMQKAPVLVLDEPTSALDSEVEKDIQEAINSLRKASNVTIIVIAHRLSTIREADRIVVIRSGRIIEEGTHNQLLISKEWYHKVSGMQTQSINSA